MKILIIGGAGYIGSALNYKLKSYDIDNCDELLRGNPAEIYIKYMFNSDSLSEKIVQIYDVIIWVAGCSNVIDSLNDPINAFQRNIIEIFTLYKKMNKSSKLIYMSTGSLYSSVKKGKNEFCSEKTKILCGENPYDISKFCFDYIAQSLTSNCLGLRLGTVSGWAPNMRRELVFNAMNTSAINERKIRVKNGESHRSIVFIDHLVDVITSLINTPHQRFKKYKFLNVASWTGTINQLAKTISTYHNAEIVEMEDTPTYDFKLNCTRLESMGLKNISNLEDEIKKYSSYK